MAGDRVDFCGNRYGEYMNRNARLNVPFSLFAFPFSFPTRESKSEKGKQKRENDMLRR